MTDAKRLERLLTVANQERWVDGDQPNAAANRHGKDVVPMSRTQLMKRLRWFINGETMINVERVGMNVREWTPRFEIDGLRADLTDHEIEAIRLEELRSLLGTLMRGELAVPIAISVAVRDGEQSIRGPFPDVVLYLAARLLTDSQLTVGMCEAPEAGEAGHPNACDRPCPGVFITQRSGKGRRRFCDGACKIRARNPKWRAHLRQAARLARKEKR